MMKTPFAIACRSAGPCYAMGAAALLSGCVATSPPNNYFEVTVRPGSSVLCASDPCTVYFASPAGSGTHNILQDGAIKVGVGVGGQRVRLGVYSNESVTFHVEGTNLPVAYLTVIGGPL